MDGDARKGRMTVGVWADGDSRPTIEQTLEILEKVEDERLQLLIREYELLNARQDQLDARYWSIIGGGLGIASVIAGYVLANTRSIEIGVLAPLFFVVYFSALIYLLYMSLKTMWTLRVLSIHINNLLGKLSLIQYEPGLPESRFYSFRHGSPKYRLLYLIIPGAAVALFVAVLSNSATTIHGENHLYATLVVATYALIAVLLITAFSGALVDLAKVYRNYLELMEREEYRGNQHLPGAEAFRRQLDSRRGGGSTFGWLLPRPVDLVVKLPAFWIGFTAALLTVGVSNDQLARVNFLFFPGKGEWSGTDEVPLPAILAMGLVYFLVSDVVLQQAKLLWNDVRDMKRDQNEPVFAEHYSNRGVQGGGIGRGAGAASATARWILALPLGWLLGGWTLFILFVLISLHQIVYEFVAKPKAGKWSIFIIIWLSLTLPLKFLTGALAVVGPELALLFRDHFEIFMLLALGFFHSVGQMAIIWRLEAEDHHLKHRLPYDPQTMDTSTRNKYLWDLGGKAEWPYGDKPRRQSGYYARRGWVWQNIGVWGAFVIAGALFLDSLPVVDDRSRWIWAIAVPVVIILLLHAGVRLVARKRSSVHVVKKRLAGLFLACYLPPFILVLLSVWFEWPWMFYMSLAVVNSTWLFLDPDTSHYQYRFMPLFIGITPVAKAWYSYLFTPEESPGFEATLAFTGRALQADPRANGAIIRATSRPAELYVVCGNGKFLLPGERIHQELSQHLAMTNDGHPVITMDVEVPDTIDRPTTFASILTDWPRTGTLIWIKQPDESGKQLAFVVGGAALLVPDIHVLKRMGRSPDEACTISSEAVGKLLGRMPQDGTLVRERSASKVYLVDNEALHFVYRVPLINNVSRSDNRYQAAVIVVPDGCLSALSGSGNR